MTIINLIGRKCAPFTGEDLRYLSWSDPVRIHFSECPQLAWKSYGYSSVRESVTSPRTGTRTRIPDLWGRRTWPAHIGTVCGGTRNMMHTRIHTHFISRTHAHTANARHQFTAQFSCLRFRRCSIFTSDYRTISDPAVIFF